MKAALVVVGLLTSSIAYAGEIDPAAVQLWDVVYTADGSVLKGVIVEEVPGTSVRVVLVGGSSIVVQMTNVQRFTKELNPAYERGAPAARAAVPAPAPMPPAPSGLRLGFLPSVATHKELDETTFMMIARVGWEIGLEKWGLTPGAAVLYAADTGVYANDSFGLHATIKAAYRASTVSPFIGFGLGVDFVSEDPSLATLMTAGIELVVHRRIALVLEGRLQKGFGGTYTDVHEFAAFGIGVEVRL